MLHARLGRVAPPLRFLLDPLVPLGPRAPPDADHCRQGASAHRRPAGAGGRAIAMPHVGSRPQPTGPLDRNSKRAATPDRVVVRPNLSGSGRPRASSDVEVAAAPPGLRPVRQPAFLLPRAGSVTAICAPRSKPRGDRARRSTFASPASVLRPRRSRLRAATLHSALLPEDRRFAAGHPAVTPVWLPPAPVFAPAHRQCCGS